MCDLCNEEKWGWTDQLFEEDEYRHDLEKESDL